ncbi:sensor histidine kinase [Paenibacillus sp. CFBP13512]|uniref:sensor histidine kinase n=1 Tax=Paenibacillus sp. CFBP13512 TaxID=2184007 RepID=UPI0010C072F1|nr:sensor histidine kinase [Paenibacillus sp. CFBP13512]TKJ92828.1 sensor histidine kinase [Paenibacillus sp. CFBP13512]
MQKKHLSEIALELRKPVILWILMVHIGTTLLETTSHNSVLHIVIASLGILCFMFLNWKVTWFIQRELWVYYVLQSAILLMSVYFMNQGYYLVMIVLYPIIIGQLLYAPYKKITIIISIAAIYIVCIAYMNYLSFVNLLFYISLFTLMNVLVGGIINLTLRQFYAKSRTQHFLKELEIAHHQVEELTVANERQRMARDLHDTLAQGLAGLIMQLEAIDAHLSSNNTKRAHEIVHLSMSGARHTLAEARSAIDDLRLHTALQVNFAESVEKEVDHFLSLTGIPIQSNIVTPIEVSQLIYEHSIHIIRECLTNIIKHAQAHHVELNISYDDHHLVMDIKDDGIGFDMRQIGSFSGHYGLIGMQERIRIVQGTLEITNRIPHGTSVHIEIPLR